MLRLRYLIYIPLLCSLVTLISLLCWYIAVCSSSDASVSNTIKQEVGKHTSDIQPLIHNLKTREDQQMKLLSQIENMKLALQQQHTQREVKKKILQKPYQFNVHLPTIYAITPTYARFTQKADLTRLSQTLLHVQNFHWILVEDSEVKTGLVKRFLLKCNVKYTHLAIKTSPLLAQGESEPRWLKARGAEQRNLGLKWLRENFNKSDGDGVVYFMDDDNTYDLELFEQMRQTKKVSIWPVALVGGLLWEGPVCKNGKVTNFHAAWDLQRPFQIDMAGFAINLQLLLNNPSVEIDVKAQRGHLESSLLKQLVKYKDLEPLADNCSKILVWHTQTMKPKMKQEYQLMLAGKSSPKMEV